MGQTVQDMNPRRRTRIFSSPKHPDQLWSPPNLLFSGHQLLSGGKAGRAQN